MLDAQEHDDIGLRQHRIEVVRDVDAQLAEDFGHEGGGADQRDARAKLAQRPEVGARHAAEEDVAADDDVERFPGRSGPKRSRMVKTSSSAWVGCSCAPSPALSRWACSRSARKRSAGGGMAQDDEVGLHGLEHLAGVLERLALAEGARFAVDGDDVGAEPARGQLEGGAGAGAGLDEEVDHRAAGEGPFFQRGGAVLEVEQQLDAASSTSSDVRALIPAPGW